MTDCIWREDAIELLQKPVTMSMCCTLDECLSKRSQRQIDLELIKSLPPADVVERKKGKWIWDDEGYHCSECWFHAHGNTLECMDGTYKYCPSCGAEMEGE